MYCPIGCGTAGSSTPSAASRFSAVDMPDPAAAPRSDSSLMVPAHAADRAGRRGRHRYQWTLGANKIVSRDALNRKYSMGFKSETLQHTAFIFDRNLNINVTITQDQPKT